MTGKLIAAVSRRIPYFVRYRLQPAYERFVDSRLRPIHSGRPAFFIVGSQRSGTTLLGLMLGSHPGIGVIDEGRAYHEIRSGTASPDGVFPGYQVPVCTRRFRMIQGKFPRALFLFMKRDIRSITASMLSLSFGSRTWVDLNAGNEIERSIPSISDPKRRAYFDRVYRRRIDRSDSVELAALCAYLKLLWIAEYRKAGVPVLEVPYERLVREPKSSMTAILEFLGLTWNDAVMEHHMLHSGVATGLTDRTRRVDTDSIEKWRDQLSTDEVMRIAAVVALGREYDAEADAACFCRSDIDHH